ncbi:motile sperm domain-containing protein 2 isoform X3 [Parasteatoda tepidariorum]|uniref:motile sperm domain-containing protein 2 isoform X3 n=1 Tax=Parasteatoda tepidariorum TaxID=114398 RepID=UPI001C719024|nr:motile sperm domain-containing protein 2 isoform X1 [Parasteatoda tepidariorum]
MVVPVETPASNDNEPHLLLRSTFLENLNSKGNYDDYEQCDIDKIRNDDAYCKRYINHKKGNFDAALEMVDEALKWRKSFGVKDVTAASIPREFFEAKAVFPYNKDKENNPIIMLLVRFHKKAPDFAKELRRFVIYWVELMEEQTKGGRMSVIMSCEGAGLSNLDLDLIKFLITLFRSYYPDSLAHILIYEFPWILNPAWKIIKAWLPEDFVEKIKFVNKTTVQNFVTAENLPVDMGGTDTTEWEPPSEADINSNTINGTEKRVRFSSPAGSKSVENGIPRSSIPGQVVITDDYTIIGGILKISPATKLIFDTQVSSDVAIKLSCAADKTVSYKVKTNNIESYRVKPSLGVIQPGNTVDINVVLLSGFNPQPTDKFLIMAMEVSDPTLSGANLSNAWKSASPNIIADHKLKCMLKDEEPLSEESEMEKTLKNINSLLTNLENKVATLDKKQNSLHLKQNILLVLTFFLMGILLFHVFLHNDFFSKTFKL